MFARSSHALLGDLQHGLLKRTWRPRKARSYLFQSTVSPLGLVATNGTGRSGDWQQVEDEKQFGAAMKKSVLVKVMTNILARDDSTALSADLDDVLVVAATA